MKKKKQNNKNTGEKQGHESIALLHGMCFKESLSKNVLVVLLAEVFLHHWETLQRLSLMVFLLLETRGLSLGIDKNVKETVKRKRERVKNGVWANLVWESFHLLFFPYKFFKCMKNMK